MRDMVISSGSESENLIQVNGGHLERIDRDPLSRIKSCFLKSSLFDAQLQPLKTMLILTEISFLLGIKEDLYRFTTS